VDKLHISFFLLDPLDIGQKKVNWRTNCSCIYDEKHHYVAEEGEHVGQ